MTFVNTTNLIQMSSIESKSLVNILNVITTEIIIYIPIILFSFGFIGFIGNILTFLQPELRSNTCCIYLLASSIVDMSNLVINLMPYFLSTKYGLNIPWYISSYLCKLYAFLTMFIPHLAIDFVLMSIVDRFASTSSLTSSIRRINQLKMIPWIITLVILSSVLAYIYAIVLYDQASDVPWCTFTHPMVASIFYISFIGIMQPVLIFIFVLLTYRNIRRSQRQVGIVNTYRKNRFRNRFIAMIFTHVLTTMFFSLQWIILFTYISITEFVTNNSVEYAIINFFFPLTYSFYYLNNVKSFYLSISTSNSFRRAFFHGFIQFLPRSIRQQLRRQ